MQVDTEMTTTTTTTTTTTNMEDTNLPLIDRKLLFEQLDTRIKDLSNSDHEANRILTSLLETINKTNTNTIVDIVRILDFLESVTEENRGAKLVEFLKNVLSLGDNELFDVKIHFDKLNQYVKSLFLYEAIYADVHKLLHEPEQSRQVEIKFQYTQHSLDDAIEKKQFQVIIAATRRIWLNLQETTSLLQHYSKEHVQSLCILSTLYLLGSNHFMKAFDIFQQKLSTIDSSIHQQQQQQQQQSIESTQDEKILFAIFFLDHTSAVHILQQIGFYEISKQEQQQQQ